MANDGATSTGRNHQPARPDAQATLPNRNNTSFKIPRNALKINLEPNPNRNKNSVRPNFTGCGPRHHESGVTNRIVRIPVGFAGHESRPTPRCNIVTSPF